MALLPALPGLVVRRGPKKVRRLLSLANDGIQGADCNPACTPLCMDQYDPWALDISLEANEIRPFPAVIIADDHIKVALSPEVVCMVTFKGTED